jgi:hypothetical protein
MNALIIHLATGILFIALFFYWNAYLYRGGWNGARITGLEAL